MATIRTEINITPMSMKNGVLGISTKLGPVKNWSASSSIKGSFIYAKCKDSVCATPKTKLWRYEDGEIKEINPAWQFTVNNPIQFRQLCLDGVNTQVAEKVIGEKLICDIDFFQVNGVESFEIRVIEVQKETSNGQSKKLKGLIKQQLYSKKKMKGGIQWTPPSEWIDINEASKYTQIHRALYMWEAVSVSSNLRYLYIGIVGDEKNKYGVSKRSLAERLKEHKENYKQKGIRLTRFRFDALIGFPNNIDPAEILKTAEMREITALTAIIPCKNAQKQIGPLLPACGLVLLNKSTAYHSCMK